MRKLLVLALLAACGPPSPEEIRERNEVVAWTACQGWVKNRLRSPSTADFPSLYSDKVTALSDSVYVVRAYVDAQNGFGATVRTNFVCMTATDGDSWRLREIAME